MKKQFLPIFLTLITFLGLSILLFILIYVLNLFPIQNKIITHLHIADVVVGMTIYLKTSIDFVIFIGNLMHTYPGWKNRIGIEVGTALGNAFGTFGVLIIWTFFKEVPLLLAIMILLASLVLLQMAEDGFIDYLSRKPLNNFTDNLVKKLLFLLKKINFVFRPFLSHMLPHTSLRSTATKNFWQLILFSCTIPFVLGLDDFAGYIPLFSIINVFGFAIGIFLGHMILNISLFTSPKITTRIAREPIITMLGGFVFTGLSLWGLFEAYRAFLLIFH